MADDNDRVELLGAPGSPYSRKMIAYLRYRRIPYAIHWSTGQAPPGYPEPKVRLLPTFYFRDAAGEYEAMVDSTPIIRRLESDYARRATLPEHPVLAFLNYLIEDYADEWGTKIMFHYRWAHEVDAKHAAPLLAYWGMPQAPAEQAMPIAEAFARRQMDRLYVVGSNAITAATIEDSYRRLLAILDTLIQHQGFALGARPSSADFALYGQLTQLVGVEPTPSQIAASDHPRVRAWVDRMEDLSGIVPGRDDWADIGVIGQALSPLLQEIGRVYVPFLLANANAAAAGDDSFEADIDGRSWTQPTFPYQAKCLGWIREEFAALDSGDQDAVRVILYGSGCAALFD